MRSMPIRRRRAALALLAVSLSILAGTRVALANGRYPYAQQLIVDPSDPGRLFLRATYGLLATSDGGATWSWICDAAVGYDPQEDPMLAALADGTVLAGASKGLFATSDHGCSWLADPTIGSRFVRDLATEDGASRALALAVSVGGDGTYHTTIFRSGGLDAGVATWSAIGPAMPDVVPTTLDPAPSDPGRIYVAGATTSGADAGADGRGVLLRSRDGGATWEVRDIPGTTARALPFIAAVHPTKPDVLYVRVQGAFDGIDPVESRLLYSEDAGDHFQQVFRGTADMLGFALGTDGSRVFVGLGDTHDPNRPVDASVLGMYRSSAPNFQFTRVLDGQVGCLTVAGDSLYVCGGTSTDQFELAVSHDGGDSLAPLLKFGGVAGPLACPATSLETTQCAPIWKYNCGPIGSCPTDAGSGGRSTGSSNSGCGCGSPGSKPGKPGTSIGTARLGMTSDSLEELAPLLFLAAGFLRRLARRKRVHS